MSWVLSAIVVCGTLAVFAAGTLSDKTFGFPYLVGGRHGTYRREDAGSGHNDALNDTCTPGGEEFDNRLEALRCSEEYREAVLEEIERSNCVNEAYDFSMYESDDPDPCALRDERDDVNVRCSDGCATNQYVYLMCKTIGEKQAQLFRECGAPQFAEVHCTYSDKGFCNHEPFTSSNLPTIYDECFKKNNMNASICSDECKEALEYMKDEQGCCMNIYFVIPLGIFHNDVGIVTLSEELLSACEIEIPETCKSFPPPEEFLECARDSDVDDDKDGDVCVSPTIFCSTTSVALIMVSLFNAM